MAMIDNDKLMNLRVFKLEQEVKELKERIARFIKCVNVDCVVFGASLSKTCEVVVIDNVEYTLRLRTRMIEKNPPNLVIVYVDPEQDLNYDSLVTRADLITDKKDIPLFGVIDNRLTEKVKSKIINEFDEKKKEKKEHDEELMAQGFKYKENTVYDHPLNEDGIKKIHKCNISIYEDIFKKHKLTYFGTDSCKDPFKKIMEAYELLE